ncbi:MAG: hypothetical protein IKY64_04125 [Bacteroidaceae bacterium]|nr:hypothetical protein [Bacteroidaceae bacterium]
MSFNEYWKAKAAKRRKAWAAVAKRFAEKHTQLEEIRKKVYLPLDYDYRFSFEDYKVGHFVEQNPIAEWKQMQFCFSESGLRGALEAEGADLTSFTMQVSRESIVGVEAPCPQNRWEAYPYPYITTKVYDNERAHHAWLKRVYDICTDVETVSLTYGEVTMTIKRYSKEGIPFGYYELNPCELLTKAAMMMQETDFNILNVATLLMEIDATWKLRQEELNFYAKKLRLRTMEAAVADDKIEFTPWDDKKLEKKVKEYKAKGYPRRHVEDLVLRPYKTAVKKYFNAAIDRSQGDEVVTLSDFDYYSSNRDYFFEQELRPQLKAALKGVAIKMKGESTKTITITYQGYSCSLCSSFQYSPAIQMIPDMDYKPCVDYDRFTINLPMTTPLSAIVEFVRQMPAVNCADDYCSKIWYLFMWEQDEE